MTALEWLAQGALLLLLAALVPFGWRLDRQVQALRRESGGLADGARGVAEATEAAEAALTRLRATAEGSGRLIAERVATAEKLRDDLAFLTERADTLADRLDGLVRQARPRAAEPTAEPAAAPDRRSEAERELLRALKGLR
jgi:septal ring factor EnvC (AmiA/AmiB activator)